MTRGLVIAGVATLVLAELQPGAQTTPDFSGAWVLAGPTPSSPWCANSFTATEDAATLTLDYGAAPVSGQNTTPLPSTTSGRRVIYFDGTDTREPLPPPRPRPADTPPGTWIATTVASVARAAWNGDQLIIVTHRALKISWPSQMPGEFDRQQTFRDALSLDGNGPLVIDRIFIIDPLPGGLPVRLELPTSWKCTYRKGP